MKNFNIALRYCRGDLIATLDGDDLYYPEKLKTQVEYLLKNDDCAICYHNAHVMIENTDNIYYHWFSRFGKREGSSRKLARYGPYASAASTLFRKKHIPIHGHNPLVRTQGDWLMLIESLEISGDSIRYIDEILAGIRIHKDNVSNNWPNKLYSRFKSIEIASGLYPHLKKYLHKYEADLHLVESMYQLSQLHLIEATSSLIKAIVKSFPNVLALLRLPLREVLFNIKNKSFPHPFKSRIIE